MHYVQSFFLFILKRHILILSIFFIFVVFKKFGIRFGFCEACLSFLVFSKIEQSNQSTVTLSPGHFPVISLFWVQVVCFLERSRFNLSVIKPFVLFNQMSKKSILFFSIFLGRLLDQGGLVQSFGNFDIMHSKILFVCLLSPKLFQNSSCSSFFFLLYISKWKSFGQWTKNSGQKLFLKFRLPHFIGSYDALFYLSILHWINLTMLQKSPQAEQTSLKKRDV